MSNNSIEQLRNAAKTITMNFDIVKHKYLLAIDDLTKVMEIENEKVMEIENELASISSYNFVQTAEEAVCQSISRHIWR